MGEINFRAVGTRIESSIGEIQWSDLLEQIEETIAFHLCLEFKKRVLQIKVTIDRPNAIEEGAGMREGSRFVDVITEDQML